MNRLDGPEPLFTFNRFALSPFPGIDAVGGVVVHATSAGETTWELQLGATASGRSNDRICFDTTIALSAEATLIAGPSPVFLGCGWPGVTLHTCGVFETTPAGAIRLPRFRTTELDVVLGSRGDTLGRICGPPIPDVLTPGFLGDLLSDELEGAITAEVRALTQQRGLSSGGLEFVPNCGDWGVDAATRNQACMEWVTSNRERTLGLSPDLLAARCDTVETTDRCRRNSDCPGLGRFCSGPPGLCEGTGASCDVDNNECPPLVNVPEPRCQPLGGSGICADHSPTCHWNIGVDRIESMPSGIEVIVAEDELDAFAIATEFNPLLVLAGLRNQICRNAATAPLFRPGGDVSGTLGTHRGP